MDNRKRNRIYYSLAVFIIVVGGGIAGFMIIEGYTFIEALYMTIITISTVGYGLVRPLSETGIWFTSMLIIVSFIILGVVIRNIASYLLDGEFRKIIKKRRMERQLSKLNNHVIVCGYGRNGHHAVEELLLHDEKVVVIEKDHEIVLENEHLLKNLYFVEGDATDEDTLLMANVEHAKALITTMPNDAENVFVVLTARQFNPDLLIISRASDDHSDTKLRRAGANFVIMPDSVGGHRMAKLVSQPDVIEFLDYLMIKSGNTVNIEEIPCELLPEEFIDKTLGELDVRRTTGANVIGMKLPDGTYLFNPAASTKITRNAKLFVLGTPEQVRKFKNLLNKPKE